MSEYYVKQGPIALGAFISLEAVTKLLDALDEGDVVSIHKVRGRTAEHCLSCGAAESVGFGECKCECHAEGKCPHGLAKKYCARCGRVAGGGS